MQEADTKSSQSIRQAIVRTVARCCPRWLAAYRATHLLRKKGSYLHETGYLRSLENLEPTDAHGQPLPFLNYAVIDLLKRRSNKGWNVFEFGSGYSTLFFARIAGMVTSVEHDHSWLERVKRLASGLDNVELIQRNLDDGYASAITSMGRRYDLVLIDGRMRTKCAEQAVNCLTESGIILWDDSFREKYAGGMASLEAAGFRRLPISGLKPAGFGIEESSFFYRPGNCLGI